MAIRIVGISLVVVAIYLVCEIFVPEESHKKIESFFLTSEQKVLFAECETARKTLKEQGVPGRFAEVDFMVRDERLKNDPILKDLQKCFPVTAKSAPPFRLEIEIFSSDFGKESSADLQVQVSAFELKSGNKVAEVGFRMDHEPAKEEKDSSVQPVPKKPSDEREARHADRN